MSATHPSSSFPAKTHGSFAANHPQLAPFLLAMAVFVVCGIVALAITGLPA
jgi:hypothetical protein